LNFHRFLQNLAAAPPHFGRRAQAAPHPSPRLPSSNLIRSGTKAPPSKMPAKKMRTTIKVEDGEGEVEADRGQEEAGDALREQRRRPNEGAAAAADETRSLRAAHAEAQAQAFREMEQTRAMGLELMQAKADVAKLQAEAKLKDEVFQAKDESFKSKESLWQAIIESHRHTTRGSL